MTFLQLVAREFCFAGNEAHGKFLTRHFEREECHCLVEIHRHVACHAEGAGRLTHGGTCGKDDEGAGLESRRHAVKPYEAAL